MDLKSLGSTVKGLVDSASDGASKLLDEFNEALPTMRALGFTVTRFRLNMALPPELLLTLVASVNTIDVGRIKELIQKNAEKKLLVAVLKALEAAYRVKEQLGDAAFETVHMDITLGLSPKIAVSFGPEAEAEESGEAKAASVAKA
jgi:hypothetical protein